MVFFPLSIALIAIHQPFYLYLYGVLILIYALVRHFEDASKPVSQLLWQLLGLIGFGILGLALAGFILPSNIYQIIESPRVAGGVSYFDTFRRLHHSICRMAYRQPLHFYAFSQMTF
jgi:hypothetical protein